MEQRGNFLWHRSSENVAGHQLLEIMNEHTFEPPSQVQSGKTESQAESPAQTIPAETEKIKAVIKDEAAQTGVKIKEEATVAVGHLKEAGRSFAQTQAQALASKLGEYAGAVTSLREKLNESSEPNLLAGPAETAAQQLGSLSDFLKGASPEEILQGVERLAHKKPELFYGGLFMAGLMVARFLKASGSRAEAATKSLSSATINNPAESHRALSGSTPFNPSNL